MAVPALTGLDNVSFAENAVNAAPRIIDANVAFTDADDDFNGGTLTVTGLLAEDTVSINNLGSGAGQIGYNSGTGEVSYGGVVFGVAVGGVGGILTITFDADATAAAIDALIQNLTYANSSNTPTASRVLSINVTDAAGNALSGAPAFSQLLGASNPLNAVDVGDYSTPTFTDLDNDGDLDVVVGAFNGLLSVFRNGTNGTSGAYTALTGVNNPFDFIDVGGDSTPTFVDLDADGDLDLVVGERPGNLNVFRNGTNGAAGAFTEQLGVNNPFDSIDAGTFSAPTFADVDGDGDLDLVVGEYDGGLKLFRNGTNGASGAFTELTGGDNPFNGIDVGRISKPVFVDMDGDGDLDLLVGAYDGLIRFFRNGTDGAAGAFTEVTGAGNPFAGIDALYLSAPALADLDADGYLDLVVGGTDGILYAWANPELPLPSITITVTAEDEVPTAFADTLTGTAGADTINALAGNDTVDAGAGNDTIDGGEGDDIINAGDGADYLRGGLGADAMSGGTGNDT